MVNIRMQPVELQKLSPRIAVIGVGGAGGNAVNNMITSGLEGCEFLVCNTDAQALSNSSCDKRIQLGADVTGGLGAGSKPEVGRAAAEETLHEVMSYVDGVNMVFVTAGMGGGTGTGAAPVIAKACREQGILTVGVVTKPFHFEGSHRMRSAESGIEEMQDYVDTLIVIPNQNLFRIANEKTTFAEAFKMADSVLLSGVQGVTDLIVRPGLVNLDFADIRTAMLEMGKAMMGTGEASGEKRAIDAAEAAINNPLLDDVSMKGAHGVLINVTGGMDMTLFEADEACNRIRDEVDPDANIIFGATFDESLEGAMRVSIVATGIEKEMDHKMKPSSGSGSGVRPSGVNSRTALERTQPYKSKSQDEVSSSGDVTEDEGSSVSMSAPSASQSTQRYTAPSFVPSAPVKISSAVSSSAARSGASDLFEAPAAAPESSSSQTMRGTRYKDAFIPPKPVEAKGYDPNIVTSGYQGVSRTAMPAQDARPQTMTPPPSQPEGYVAPQAAEDRPSRLNLNPPKLPNMEERRSPSLFERISGTVQQAVGGMMSDHQHEQHRPRLAPQPSVEGEQVQAPSQGRLNMSLPSGDKNSDLDIPAFLRRQAN